MPRDLFHGYAMNAVDAKNRLAIPAAYRDVSQRRSQTRSKSCDSPVRSATTAIGCLAVARLLSSVSIMAPM